MGESDEGGHDRHHPRVAERQCGGVLTVDLGRSGHLGEGGHIRSGPGIGGLRVTEAHYASGESTSYARIFDWMPPFIMVTGIVGWVSDAVPDAVGIALIVVGAVGSAVMRRVSPAKTEATERR